MKVKFGTLLKLNGEEFKNKDNTPVLISKAICGLIANMPATGISTEEALHKFELVQKLNKLELNEEVEILPSESAIIKDTIKASSINIFEAGQMLSPLQ